MEEFNTVNYKLKDRHLNNLEKLELYHLKSQFKSITRIGVQENIQFLEDIWNFANKIENSHVNARDHLLFHVIIGSTPPEGGCTYYDFSNEYSVKSFMSKTHQTYVKP